MALLLGNGSEPAAAGPAGPRLRCCPLPSARFSVAAAAAAAPGVVCCGPSSAWPCSVSFSAAAPSPCQALPSGSEIPCRGGARCGLGTNQLSLWTLICFCSGLSCCARSVVSATSCFLPSISISLISKYRHCQVTSGVLITMMFCSLLATNASLVASPSGSPAASGLQVVGSSPRRVLRAVSQSPRCPPLVG